MAESPLVGLAADTDVAHFARRRCRDERERELYAYLAQSAPNGAYVARDAGAPVGIAIPHALDDEIFVSELFVEPSFRNSGIAHGLLEGVTADSEDALVAAVLSPEDQGAAAFFLQHRVALQTPLLEVSGAIPLENELARMAAGEYRFVTESLDAVGHRAAIAQLDRETRGSARAADHAYFAKTGRGFVFARDDEVAGYAYVWADGRIGPLAAASQAYSIQILAFSLAALRQTFGASWCTMLVPGTNVRVMRASMRAGLSIGAMRIFASQSSAADLSRYVGFHRLLF